MGPVVALVGTEVTIRFALSLVIRANVPLKVTVAPVRLAPTMVTLFPTGPAEGENLLIVGSTDLHERVKTRSVTGGGMANGAVVTMRWWGLDGLVQPAFDARTS